MSSVTINGKKYDSIEDYLNGKESIPEIHNWKRDGDNLECEHCNKMFTIGQQVDYVDNGTGVSTISGEKSGVNQAIADGKLQAADFGTNGEQTIHRDSETKWIVLGIEDGNKNGVNETLLLTTETPTTEKITLYGESVYNNGVTEINRVCKEMYGEEARGITINDVNECLQYEPPVATYGIQWSLSEAPQYFTINEHLKISELGEEYHNKWSRIQEYCDGVYYTPEFPNGTTDKNALGNLEVDGYEYSVRSDYILPVAKNATETTTNLIFKSDAYLLASRSMRINYYESVHFGIGIVYNTCVNTAGGSGINSPGGRCTCIWGFRPVISLRSDLPNVVE